MGKVAMGIMDNEGGGVGGGEVKGEDGDQLVDCGGIS